MDCAALDHSFDSKQRVEQTNSFESFSLPSWNKAIEKNHTGAFPCIKVAVELVLDKGRGVIISICSIDRPGRIHSANISERRRVSTLQTCLLLHHEKGGFEIIAPPGTIVCRKEHTGKYTHSRG